MINRTRPDYALMNLPHWHYYKGEEDRWQKSCNCIAKDKPGICGESQEQSSLWFTERANAIAEFGKTALGNNTIAFRGPVWWYSDAKEANLLLGIKGLNDDFPDYFSIYFRVLLTLYNIKIKVEKCPRGLEKDFKKIAAHAEPFIFEYLGMDKSGMFMQLVTAGRKRSSSSSSSVSSSSSSAPRKRNGRPLQPGQQPYVSCQTRVWAGRGDQVLLPALLSIIEQYDCFIATFCWLSNDRVLDAMRGKALYLRIEDNKDNKEELYKDILVSEVDTFKCGQHEYDVELLRASPSANGLSHSHSKMLVAGSLRDGVFIPVVGIVGSYNPSNTSSMDSMVEMYPADHVAHAILQETFIES